MPEGDSSTGLRARVPPDARWDCSSCGECCKAFRLGPVAPSIIEGLRGAHIEQLWPPAAQAPWAHRERAPDGTEAWFLAHRERGCVFLRDDNLCAIHATLGPEAKPSFCREFPLQLTLEPGAVVLTARADCSGLHHSLSAGTDLAEHLKATLALPRVVPVQRFDRDPVPILPGVDVPYADYAPLERSLLATLHTPAPVGEALSAMRHALTQQTGLALPTPEPDRAEHALRAVLDALHQTLAPIVQGAPPDTANGVFLQRTVRQMQTLIEGGLEGPASARAFSDGAQRYTQLTLRSLLMGKQWNGQPDLAGALGLWALGLLLAARVAPGHEAITPADLGHTVAPWLRLTHNGVVSGLLQRAHPALVDLFLHFR